DDRSGQDETIGEVDAKVSLESIDSPLSAEGGLTWNARRIAYTLEAATLSGLLAGTETPVSLKVASDTVTTGFKGKIKLATPLLLAGALDLDTASVRELAAWLRHPLPPGGGLGPLALRADVTAGGSKVTASNAAVKLDGATAKGILGLELAGKRPMLRADLAIDQLDLNPYLAGAEVAPQGKAAKAKASGDTSGGSATAVATPAVASTSTGWSNAPIDLSALNLLDADAKIAAGSIRLRNIKIGRSTVQATLTGGLLKARLPAMQLYGGQGTGALSVDARAPAAKIDSNFNLKAIQVQPLLTDAAGIDRLAGSGDVSFGGASSGRSQKELVSALMGQGKAQLADGAVVGVNVARAVRSMQSGNFTDWTSDPEAKTDFSSLTATFTVTNGVAATGISVFAAGYFRRG
nr:AsmA family protein [Thermoanaerobaculia bacterium]